MLLFKELIQHFESQFEAGNITSLEDKEVHHQTEFFDRIAHRFSFYEARISPTDEAPFAVGVTSMQLVKIDGKWLVSSMAWNDDNRGTGFFERVIHAPNKSLTIFCSKLGMVLIILAIVFMKFNTKIYLLFE